MIEEYAKAYAAYCMKVAQATLLDRAHSRMMDALAKHEAALQPASMADTVATLDHVHEQ